MTTLDLKLRLPADGSVFVDLQGGLGNQLFQYAVGRALARSLGARLILNLRLLRLDAKRRYALDAYPISADIIDSEQFPVPGRIRRWFARAGWRTGSLSYFPFEEPLYQEVDTEGCWDPRVEQLRSPAVLRGYFQSERYFVGIARELRSELSPLRVPTSTFLNLQKAIDEAGAKSASLHVRRGDYSSDPATLAFHGLLGEEYYGPALRLLRSEVPDARLFIFTDDPSAAASMLPPELEVTFVSGQGLTDVDELALMSRCRNHIIANSSYSWWGAWLGGTEGLTIAPRRWFAKLSDASILNRFPRHWHVVG